MTLREIYMANPDGEFRRPTWAKEQKFFVTRFCWLEGMNCEGGLFNGKVWIPFDIFYQSTLKDDWELANVS